MATATKTLRTLQSSTSNGAGSTTTSSTWTLTTAFGGTMTIKITNGGTGPSAACTAAVNISGDGTNWKQMLKFTGDTTNSSVNEWAVEVPDSVMYAQVVFTGNATQAVTVEAFGQELTSIA